MVSVHDFIQQVQYIHANKTVKYQNGMSGQLSGGVYLCDCRGLVIWALRLCSHDYKSTGTNWMIRKQMQFTKKVSKASDLEKGMLVFKYRQPGDSGYSLPQRYKAGQKDYDEKWGLADVYHVGVVVQTSPTLIIRHCSSGGIRTDTALGKWSIAGWLDALDAVLASFSPSDTPVTVYPINGKVVAEKGSTVNIRQNTSTQSKLVCRVQIGQKVMVTGEKQDGFYPVDYNGKTGYIKSDFLEV